MPVMTTANRSSELRDDDRVLLDRFAREGSNQAFAQLARRYVDLVYATALRRLRGDACVAEEVTQAVFIILSRRAGSLGASVLLPGWLHRATCYACANAIKMEARRKQHEHRAAIERPTTTTTLDRSDDDWSRIAPALDEAISALGDVDRNAILLRYYEGKSVEETGSALGLSGEAAKKRLQRALGKLRSLLTRKGVSVPAGALAAALGAHALVAGSAPAYLAAAVASSTVTAAHTVTASSLIAKGTAHMLLIHQLKLIASLTTCAIIIAALTGAAIALTRGGPTVRPYASTASSPATSPAQTTFSNVIELTINDDGIGHDECVDLDAGKTISGPRQGWASQQEGLKWFRATGADAHCETDPGESGLYGRDLVIVPVENDRWDKATPSEIETEMKDALPQRPVMAADGDLPLTYQFRTREGGIGILQIVQIFRDAQNHGWIKVRYRLVK
jgi:RNA polymerase sigma factor (sigma-70 family)